ncbi:MAG: SDR family oxidoreductase [Solirubrobacteraceae bacterium]
MHISISTSEPDRGCLKQVGEEATWNDERHGLRPARQGGARNRAASGIGRATAELFAAQGARVVGSDLDAEHSKHGVLGLTRTAAIEYASAGIRVNAVCPGAIDTPMMDETFERFPGFRESLLGFVPLGRMGRPDEVAGVIAWLCSPGLHPRLSTGWPWRLVPGPGHRRGDQRPARRRISASAVNSELFGRLPE